ncbi:MAG: ABC transporter substrate-binding protein [Bacteroidales bacterium]|nr:ABC transporter substrate-binding protein [Bacteroidales bacterium]
MTVRPFSKRFAGISLPRFASGIFTLLLLLLTTACGGGRRSTPAPADSGVPEWLKYATNLAITHYDGWAKVQLRNPWDTAAVLHTYLLVPSDKKVPENLPKGTLVRTPLRRAGVATAVACGLIAELGCADAIAGVCEKQYIHQPEVQQGLKNGRVADFGNGMNPDIERIMEVGPDALLLTPFEHSGGYGRVERLGIPIIECAEYMETSALGRAEWIHFYALLFGAEFKGDSIFSSVEQNYLTLSQKAKGRSAGDKSTRTRKRHLPSVLTETLYGGQWFVPCAESTMGRMLEDAGAVNPFSDKPGSGSVGLAIEEVLTKAQDADLWLVKYNQTSPVTYTSLARDYSPYTQFRAWKERRIWGCDLDATHFYEETPFHPDRLLHDFVAILHPYLLADHSTHYYHPLEE